MSQLNLHAAVCDATPLACSIQAVVDPDAAAVAAVTQLMSAPGCSKLLDCPDCFGQDISLATQYSTADGQAIELTLAHLSASAASAAEELIVDRLNSCMLSCMLSGSANSVCFVTCCDASCAALTMQKLPGMATLGT